MGAEIKIRGGEIRGCRNKNSGGKSDTTWEPVVNVWRMSKPRANVLAIFIDARCRSTLGLRDTTENKILPASWRLALRVGDKKERFWCPWTTGQIQRTQFRLASVLCSGPLPFSLRIAIHPFACGMEWQLQPPGVSIHWIENCWIQGQIAVLLPLWSK